jgi:hypothetical protein
MPWGIKRVFWTELKDRPTWEWYFNAVERGWSQTFQFTRFQVDCMSDKERLSQTSPERLRRKASI